MVFTERNFSIMIIPNRTGGIGMKHRSAKWKKGDWLAVLLVCLLAAGSACALPVLRSEGSYAQIYLDGQLVRQVPLSVDQSFQITGDYVNTVTVSGGRIAVTASSCPNEDCVHMGWLQDGGTIVCLPNRMQIRLTGQSGLDALLP